MVGVGGTTRSPPFPVAAMLFLHRVPAIYCPLVAFRIGSLPGQRKNAAQRVDWICAEEPSPRMQEMVDGTC